MQFSRKIFCDLVGSNEKQDPRLEALCTYQSCTLQYVIYLVVWMHTRLLCVVCNSPHTGLTISASEYAPVLAFSFLLVYVFLVIHRFAAYFNAGRCF